MHNFILFFLLSLARFLKVLFYFFFIYQLFVQQKQMFRKYSNISYFSNSYLLLSGIVLRLIKKL